MIVVIIKKYFNNVGNRTTFETEGMTELLQSTMGDVFSLLLPILIVTFITAIAGSVVQVGFVFTPKALGFKFNKLISLKSVTNYAYEKQYLGR